MSASIAAAQRRRAGPPDTGRPGGGPKPSINSASAFHGQGQGQAQRPNMPTGRLAGQHAAQQQAQDRQQYAANQKANNSLVDESGNSKITIAQAITLITLRLGKLETAFYQIQMHLNEGGLPSSNINNEFGENVKLVDNSVIESIIARLESLEKRGTVSSSNSNTDVSALKQQVDLIKPSVITLKNASLSNTKDIKELNGQLTSLFEEMNVLRGELSGLQGVVNEFTNGQLEMEYSDDNNGDGQEELDGATSLDELDSNLLNVTNGKLDLTDLTM
jgi:hypothetical protein